ncbi:hypothetical protein B0A50_05498 [Salinomyces thailandicus]|uniref:Uncharacterized protein n=1 Tax=Salinomyces thailandicus TaxID=706561 RepID=A0A4U0TVF9_9PEZI|nr:hypothetical protein B0A50_05498 [Salinomyces thailandica]
MTYPTSFLDWLAQRRGARQQPRSQLPSATTASSPPRPRSPAKTPSGAATATPGQPAVGETPAATSVSVSASAPAAVSAPTISTQAIAKPELVSIHTLAQPCSPSTGEGPMTNGATTNGTANGHGRVRVISMNEWLKRAIPEAERMGPAAYPRGLSEGGGAMKMEKE